ncbi:MAG TPA: hypothetical protein ENJ30_12660, partial [Desulfobulbaceae bacterium]|nr:hypothetical protein [Desulfobulbaceae bacterium]
MGSWPLHPNGICRVSNDGLRIYGIYDEDSSQVAVFERPDTSGNTFTATDMYTAGGTNGYDGVALSFDESYLVFSTGVDNQDFHKILTASPYNHTLLYSTASTPLVGCIYPSPMTTGELIFEGDGNGGDESIYRLTSPNPSEAFTDISAVGTDTPNDNAPFCLANSSDLVVSVYLSRAGNTSGAHEIVFRNADGTNQVAPSMFYGKNVASGTFSGFSLGASDTTPPNLSSPTATGITSSSVVLGATTDEGNGTAHAIIVPNGEQGTPTNQEVIDGNYANTVAVAADLAISAIGAFSFTTTSGLSASTQYGYVIVHVDAAGNEDAGSRVEGAFTTAAAATVTQAFRVSRSSSVIPSGATSLTLTAGTDYTAPAGADRAFIRIVNSRLTGMGRTAGGGNQNTDDFTVYFSNPENITTSVDLTRVGSATNCRVDWEVVEYVGAAGGPNEIVVRSAGAVAGTGGTIDGPAVATIADSADVAVLITGQASGNTGRADWHETLYVASLQPSGSGWLPRFERGTTVAGNSHISYAVVEFVGANWTVSREDFNTTGTTWAPGNNNSWLYTLATPVADVAKTFLHIQYATSNDPTGLDDAGECIVLDSTTQLRVFNRTTAGTRRKVVWLVQNSQASAQARNLIVQHRQFYQTLGGSEERTITDSVTAVDAIEEASIFAPTASCDGGGTAYPRGSVNALLTAVDTVTLRYSDSGQEQQLGYEVVQWPQDESTSSSVTLEAGSWAVSGHDLTFHSDSVVALDAGSWAVSGHDLTFYSDAVVSLESGSWAGAGHDLTFYSDAVVTLDPGSWAVSGKSLTFYSDSVVTLDPGSWAVSGKNLTFYSDSVVTLDPGSWA